MAKRKRYKRANNDLQNIHIKLKTGGELMCSERVGSSCGTSENRRGTLVTHPMISHERGKNVYEN